MDVPDAGAIRPADGSTVRNRADQRPEQDRLARRIRAENRQSTSTLDIEIQIPQNNGRPESNREMSHFQCVLLLTARVTHHVKGTA